MNMENNSQSGFIIINKPVGPTSHDIINKLRKITNIRKIGHAGTLDPFASGVLVCAISREATKQISKYVKLDKEYKAEIFLGATSDTYDHTGKISNLFFKKEVSHQDINKVLQNFIGLQKQVPPMYSAVKRGGKKLYELARQGIEIERGFSEIEIYEIKLIKYEWPILKIKIKCSSGTYIRSLAHDIGRILRCGAYLKELERTSVGEFNIKDSVEIKNLTPQNWQDFLIK